MCTYLVCLTCVRSFNFNRLAGLSFVSSKSACQPLILLHNLASTFACSSGLSTTLLYLSRNSGTVTTSTSSDSECNTIAELAIHSTQHCITSRRFLFESPPIHFTQCWQNIVTFTSACYCISSTMHALLSASIIQTSQVHKFSTDKSTYDILWCNQKCNYLTQQHNACCQIFLEPLVTNTATGTYTDGEIDMAIYIYIYI